MPILGLTDKKSRSVSRGVATFGKIRKGAPKPKNGNKPGADLDHFRVDFDAQYLHFADLFRQIYGDTPTEFDALLVGKTVDDVFSTWNEAWTQTKLMHRCDGQTQHVAWDDKQGYVRHIPCVGGSADKYECKGLCKKIGRLSITLPALNEAVGEFGKFIITTHSFYDIQKITNQLALLESALNTLMFVPVTVGRVKEEKTRPDDKNGRAKATFSLMYLKVKTQSIQAYIDQQSTPQLMAPTNALPATVDEFNGYDALPAPEPDQPEADTEPMGVDPEKIADWIQSELDLPFEITAPDVVGIFGQNNFNYAEVSSNMKVYGVALVLEAINMDESGKVNLDAVKAQAETLLPKSPDAVNYIMNVVAGIGTPEAD